MFRKTVTGAGALLVLFHIWLFAGQAWDGRLAEPGLLLRWVVAAALVAALVGLGRRGASIFVDRKAVAIWLLAVLLHGPAVAGQIDPVGAPALPEVAAILARIAVASAAAVGLGLLLLLHAARRRAVSFFRIDLTSMDSRPIGALPSDAFFLFAPRPPPRA